MFLGNVCFSEQIFAADSVLATGVPGRNLLY